MKTPQWTTLAILVLVLTMAGCAPAAATPIPSIVLDLDPKTDSTEFRNVQASAEVVPAQEVRLSFVISGQVQEVTVEKGSFVDPGQILAILNSPDLEYGVLQAEAVVRTAEFDYEYWKLPRRAPDRTLVTRGEVAAKELEAAQRTLETALAELTQATLVAPFAATVIAVEALPGEYVQPGQVVIVLARLDQLQIETTDLSELYVTAVRIGQTTTAYIEALDAEFPGVVTAISPISNTIGGDVVFKVTVKLDQQPMDLLWGMSADVEIQTEQ